MFERKGSRYRFSDEGVEEGRSATFQDAGYMKNDPTAWYLSDPDDRPAYGDVRWYNGCVGFAQDGQGERVLEATRVPTVVHASVEQR